MKPQQRCQQHTHTTAPGEAKHTARPHTHSLRGTTPKRQEDHLLPPKSAWGVHTPRVDRSMRGCTSFSAPDNFRAGASASRESEGGDGRFVTEPLRLRGFSALEPSASCATMQRRCVCARVSWGEFRSRSNCEARLPSFDSNSNDHEFHVLRQAGRDPAHGFTASVNNSHTRECTTTRGGGGLQRVLMRPSPLSVKTWGGGVVGEGDWRYGREGGGEALLPQAYLQGACVSGGMGVRRYVCDNSAFLSLPGRKNKDQTHSTPFNKAMQKIKSVPLQP